ncbi:hypothetical protein D3C74_91150 [compost metagenome]
MEQSVDNLHQCLKDFDAIVKHIELNCLEKCSYEVTKSEFVSLVSLWYIDDNDRPNWMNVSVRSIDSKEYFEIEMQLLDENIDEVKVSRSSKLHDVIRWIDHELGLSISKCDFQRFVQ